MKRILIIAIALLLITGCASCKWCKDSCKRTEYVDKAVNVYVYPDIMKEPMPTPEFQEVSDELDTRIQGIIGLLKLIEADRGNCPATETSVCDRTSVSDQLLVQLQTELLDINRLYFVDAQITVSNFTEAYTYYKHLEWRVKQYEEQILEIMARESKDPDALVKPK